MDIATLTAGERRRLVESLTDLTDAEWESPSLCAGWSVHLVLAHLTSLWQVTPATLGLALARRRSLDGALDQCARDLARRHSGPELLYSLRAHAESRRRPPLLGPAAPLTDVIVHGADALWPLQREWRPAVPALVESLTWVVTGSTRGFVPRDRVAGLRVVATDVGVHLGEPDGARLEGDALSLLTLLFGRTHRRDLVRGDGVEILLSRL